MTGQELIDWIKGNNAEKLRVIVEHRDSGGTYHTAEELIEPTLCSARNEEYEVINTIDYDTETPNAICL